MKTSLKFIAILLFLYFSVDAAFAQLAGNNKKAPIIKPASTENAPAPADNKTPFLGIWELYKVASNGLPLQAYPPGYIKIYEPDGSFNIIRVQQSGSIIKSSGFYAIDDEQVCREADKAEDLAGKGFKINYEFSQNNKVLTIGFSYPDGAAYTEAYRKLEPKSK
jgi:hypothetical protein